MKRILYLIFLSFFLFIINGFSQSDELVNVCALDIGDATYLKDFKIKLQQGDIKPPPSAKFSVVLNKGTTYKLNVCNAEGYEGEAIIKLLDGNDLLGTNYSSATEKFYKGIQFPCTKTGVYTINVSFKDGKEGAAVAILSFMNKN
jgi:hypothetical protein